MSERVEVKVGEVWEDKGGECRREVLFVTEEGGALTRDEKGQKFFREHQNVTETYFYKRISKPEAIHAHMHISSGLPWVPCYRNFHTQFGPPYNFRCTELPFTPESCEEEDVTWASCYRCGKTYRINPRERASLRRYCSVCGWEMIMGKPSKIDTVKVGQVWLTTTNRSRRKIVSVTRIDGRVEGISTEWPDGRFPNLQFWTRQEAEKWVIGELVEDVEPEYYGVCCKCGKKCYIREGCPVVCFECRLTVNCSQCGKPMLDNGWDICIDCHKNLQHQRKV